MNYTASLGVKFYGAIGVPFRTEYFRNAEIDQLEVIAARLQEEKVFWLDISMNNLHRVHVLNSLHKLGKVVPGFFFRKAGFPLHNPFKELTSIAKSGSGEVTP